jgi:hypothetical protein
LRCYNDVIELDPFVTGKDAKLAKVNYQYEKRQKELAKKRKKEQKEREKQQRKNHAPQEAVVTQDTQETPPTQPPENQGG